MAPFDSLAGLRDVLAQAPTCSQEARRAAETRNDALTKPSHALGRLEDLGIWVAGWQGTERPRIERPQVALFAGNHGVAARGVSAFPSEVTALMVANFEAGGAAINQIARSVGVDSTVSGVVVAGVDPSTDAGQKLKRGDVITAVNFAPVRTVADVTARIGDARTQGRDTVLLSVQRQRVNAAVPVKIKK